VGAGGRDSGDEGGVPLVGALGSFLNDREDLVTLFYAMATGVVVATSVFFFDVSIQYIHDLPDILAVGGAWGLGVGVWGAAVCVLAVWFATDGWSHDFETRPAKPHVSPSTPPLNTVQLCSPRTQPLQTAHPALQNLHVGGGRATGLQLPGDLAIPFRCIMPVGAGFAVAALQSKGFAPGLKFLTRAIEGGSGRVSL